MEEALRQMNQTFAAFERTNQSMAAAAQAIENQARAFRLLAEAIEAGAYRLNRRRARLAVLVVQALRAAADDCDRSAAAIRLSLETECAHSVATDDAIELRSSIDALTTTMVVSLPPPLSELLGLEAAAA